MEKAAIFWSGGKDSAFALYKTLKGEPSGFPFEVCYLVTTINEEFKRISMHGVREELLDAQSNSIGIPLKKMFVPDHCTNEDYEQQLLLTFEKLKTEGIRTIIYGDIFLEDLKIYRENLLSKAGLKGYFPLWKGDTSQLIHSFLAEGFQTIICCVKSDLLDKEQSGSIIDKQFIESLPATIDPCGENGEFHTFCFDGPIFKNRIAFEIGETVFKPYSFKTSADLLRDGFWFTDLFIE
ncbi:Dph6-related ATP pyrophosphatase [Solitalea koreensis]|uniref:MJ0570-related uncharacterized domain-containing protein n=1 Tax=Solitalea koreensis TaxID=543615 RepID=A0A521BD25_9SPHI|nr:diphthine--ammonia ligase [Solitalea koreensis]SMO44973.1 MJ0570-related uncharacterized domain-containing protein [Solitalea koreensis]